MLSTADLPPIERLPEELILQILDHLDNLPPSETNIRNEPSLDFTTGAHRILKDVSVVSKRWRRLVLPSLFNHTRLRLDEELRDRWKQCSTCKEKALNEALHGATYVSRDDGIDQYHVDMVEVAVGSTPTYSVRSQSSAGEESTPMSSGPTSTVEIILTWLPRFYHSLKDFLTFIAANDLASKVESFVLLTEQMLPHKLDRFPHRAAPDRDWRYRCAAVFWHHLLTVIDPARVVVMAPPADMACLTNCAIDTFGESPNSDWPDFVTRANYFAGDWAFGDMDFHILDLRLDPTKRSPSPLLGTPVEYSELDFSPRRYPGIAASSILHARPWHHITINEGCFLKAYGTYEYFERGPPSLIYSIKDCLTPRPTYSASASRLSEPPLTNLRKLTYIGIFPFANHLDFRELLPQLEELDIQLAPLLSSNILNSPERVGKAELEDCWSELVSIYQNISSQLATFRISERNMQRLKTLICRDKDRPALKDELDEVFIPLCLPVWCETLTGRFERQMMSAEEAYGPGGIGMADW